MNLQDREELWALAGEYVLGVLTAEEAAEIERLMEGNEELRSAVAYWEERLLGLTTIAPSIAPTEDLWQRIAQSLPTTSESSAVAPVPPAPASTRSTPDWWNNIRFWRFATLAAGAAAIVLAATTLFRPSVQAPAYTAVLQSPADKSPGWIVQVSNNQVQVIPLAKTTVGPNQALELWTKQERATKPTSLGLLPPDRPVQIPIDRLPGLEPGQLFEITLEPATGSPTGRPTGKILFIGRAAETQ